MNPRLRTSDDQGGHHLAADQAADEQPQGQEHRPGQDQAEVGRQHRHRVDAGRANGQQVARRRACSGTTPPGRQPTSRRQEQQQGDEPPDRPDRARAASSSARTRATPPPATRMMLYGVQTGCQATVQVEQHRQVGERRQPEDDVEREAGEVLAQHHLPVAQRGGHEHLQRAGAALLGEQPHGQQRRDEQEDEPEAAASPSMNCMGNSMPRGPVAVSCSSVR